MNDIQKNYNQLLIRYDEILKENESLKSIAPLSWHLLCGGYA